MKYYVNRIILNGSKSLDKPIELLFSNKSISSFNFEESNVKAIYGPNGAGKSGIMAAMYIYKTIVTKFEGLNDSYFSKFVYETINKVTNNLFIDVIFTLIDDENGKNKYSVYRHILNFEKNNESVFITKEEFFSLKGKTINDDNFDKIYTVNNGKVTYITKKSNDKLESNPIVLACMNLLDKTSFAAAILNGIKKERISLSSNLFPSIIHLLMFSFDLIVEINKEDSHNDYISNEVIKQILENDDINLKNNMNKSNYIFMLSTKNSDVISVEHFKEYEYNIKNLTKFIKIFKPSLDEIIIDKKINENNYYCKKIFRYGISQIDMEFESTGIKKLVKIYSALKACANGHVTFIDEMDANLHDVYFTTMIEFFKNEGSGQLCFTTHNLDPIDILKTNSHSLDFISNDSRLYSWKKDGNNSPMKNYKSGLIPYSPFNVESFDFDILFDEE